MKMRVYIREGQRLVFFAKVFLSVQLASASFIVLFFIFAACKCQHSTMVTYEAETDNLNLKFSDDNLHIKVQHKTNAYRECTDIAPLIPHLCVR